MKKRSFREVTKMMNPAVLFKMKGLLEKFNANHPKVMPFFQAVSQKGIKEGTIIEAKVQFPDETEMVTNIRVNAGDLELIKNLAELNK